MVSNMMETAMLSPDRFSDLAPLSAAAADYDVVRRAIAHIKGTWRTQPEIEQIATALETHGVHDESAQWRAVLLAVSA